KAARSTRVRSDFEFGDILGEGSYSTVIQAWDLLSIDQSRPASAGSGGVHTPSSQGAKVYAVKILDKVHILKEKKQKYVNVEKEALSLLIRHPGVITLYWTFQDSNSLYFVLELAPNGELLSFIKKLGSFDKACSRYYAAQLLDTIEGIHAAGIVHRDIKPENVLLDGEMRVKVTDFGSAKIKKKGPNKPATATPAANEEQERASSFVGTAEYVSPELLTDKSVTERSDLWAFGCVVYQIVCGRPPFKGVSEYQTFQKIIKGDYEFVDAFPEDAKDLVQGLLQLDAAKRFSIDEMKGHKFFEGVNWKGIWKEPAPELKVGIYARPQPIRSANASQSSAFEGIAWVPLSQHLSIGSASTSSGAGNDATVRASKSSRTPLFTTSTTAPDDRTFASSAADMSWAALLLPHEALLYAAPILHRQAGAFRTNSKKRQLLLTDFPRLLCVKETNDQLKVKSEVILAVPAFLSASIPFSGPNSAMGRPPTIRKTMSSRTTWPPRDSLPSAISSSLRRRDSSSSPAAAAPDPSSPNTSTTTSIKASNAAADLLPNFLSGLDQKGARTFIVQTPARSYVYEDPSGDANQWIRSITNAVQ
ncbi:Pkinase-domain-containing protein, partial [Acaromyces ingoldii]